jgi:hypothetical protein
LAPGERGHKDEDRHPLKKGDIEMRLTAMRPYTWVVALVLLVLGLLGRFDVLGALDKAAFWLVVGGLVLTLAAALVKKL